MNRRLFVGCVVATLSTFSTKAASASRISKQKNLVLVPGMYFFSRDLNFWGYFSGKKAGWVWVSESIARSPDIVLKHPEGILLSTPDEIQLAEESIEQERISYGNYFDECPGFIHFRKRWKLVNVYVPFRGECRKTKRAIHRADTILVRKEIPVSHS